MKPVTILRNKVSGDIFLFTSVTKAKRYVKHSGGDVTWTRPLAPSDHRGGMIYGKEPGMGWCWEISVKEVS